MEENFKPPICKDTKIRELDIGWNDMSYYSQQSNFINERIHN